MEAGFIALGLVQGALAALNALGLVLLWRTTAIVNLAQPAVGLVGGVLTGMLVAESGWGFGWAAPVGVAAGALLGFLSERLVMVRLARLPRVVPMVATIGLAGMFQALQSGIPFALGGRLPTYDVDIGVELFVFPVLLKGPHLLALASLPLAALALAWFVHRSRIGTAAVAAGQNLERAQALGVNTGFVRAISWAAAGALSGAAGVLSIPVLGFSLGDGVAPTVLLLALAPAAIAGMRHIAGTVAAALAVGVCYQVALVEAPTAGLADVALGLVLVLAVAGRRGALGRLAVAERASSWVAAAGVRPVPHGVRNDRRWRMAVGVAAAVVVSSAALPPLVLAPSGDVRFGTGAAIALAAVAAAVAWSLAGELALGHWGIAGISAAAAFAAPGPIVVRAVVAVVAGGAAGALLALVGQRRGALATAVAGLGIAVVAPYWLLRSDVPRLGVDAELAASVAGVTTAAIALGLERLRRHRAGVRLVIARDDPTRARRLGISPERARLQALSLSGAIAGLAGFLYLASVPAGVAPGAFDAARSLEVLAFAVVGGLGSAIGAGAGAAALVTAGVVLPAPWGAVATGFGVLCVVLFVPAGVSGLRVRVRDAIGRALVPAGWPASRPVAAAPEGEQPAPADDPVAIPAGADTRDALAVPSVRAAVVAALLLGAPAITALFGAPAALRDHAGIDVGAAASWLVLGTTAIAAVVAGLAWRSRSSSTSVELLLGGGTVVALLAFVVTGDELMVALLTAVAPVAAAWVLARLAAIAGGSVVRRSRAAATGAVIAAAGVGAVGALHLSAVATNGILDVARWTVGYIAVGTGALAAAAARAPADRARARARDRATPASTARRRWAPLRADDVTVDFGGHRVLDGVDLLVESGQLVVLAGGNGSGKSTLLRTVAGFVPLAAGRIDVAGSEITALRPDERAAAGVAFVDGARPVFPGATVAENLRVGASLTHRTRRSFERGIEHVLEIVPVLGGRLDTQVGALSGGEQRQLAVAQTLFRRPSILLADELTLGLDAAARQTVLALLRSLADDGVGVVVVDHELAAVAAIADRALVLHDGALTELDDPNLLAEAAGDLLPARFLAGATR